MAQEFNIIPIKAISVGEGLNFVLQNLIPLRITADGQIIQPKAAEGQIAANHPVASGVHVPVEGSFQVGAKELALAQGLQQEFVHALSSIGVSVEGAFLSLDNLLFPFEGLFSAFQDAFYSYLNLDEGTFAKQIDFLAEYASVQSDPNFLNLTFEQLFNIPVAEGGSDAVAVAFSGGLGGVESISVPINLESDNKAGEVTSVTSVAQTLTVPPPFIISSPPTTVPPPPTGTPPVPPTTPTQTIDNAQSSALNFAPSTTYSGNFFTAGPYNGNKAATFGPDGGTTITANFAESIPGSTVTNIRGATILTLPDGNSLTVYTANVDGHKVGDYVYTLVAPHLIATTTASIEIIDGQRFFIDTFEYSLTTNRFVTRTGTITVIIEDDHPVATDHANLTPSNESNIQGVGSNLSTSPNILIGSLLTSPTDAQPNHFGANGGSVTNVTIQGGSTVIGATTITVTDAFGNELVINKLTGEYNFILNHPIINENNEPSINVYHYQLTDNNGNVASANLTITVNDDIPVAVNINAGAIGESNIENIGSHSPLIPNTLAGFLVPETPTASDSRYGADGAAATGGITNVTLSSIAGATENGTTPITATTTTATITQAEIDNSNGALTSANLGNKSIVITDSLGNQLIVDAMTGQYIYTLSHAFHQNVPDADATVTFSYQITDSDGSNSSAQLIITVNDDKPIAAEQTNSADETALFVSGSETAIGNLVTNGTSFGADGGEITQINGTSAVNGIITVSTMYGTLLVYTVAQDGHQIGDYIYTLDSTKTTPVDDSLLNVTDGIIYQLTDGDGSTVSGNLNIVVDLNQAPTADADANSTDNNAALDVSALFGVLSNDTDPDAGDTKTVSAINGTSAEVGVPIILASGAIITLNADGSYSYNPNGAFDHLTIGQQDTDQINYTMHDAEGLVSTTTLTITVNGTEPLNVNPVANSDSATVSEVGILNVPAATGLLQNDTDANVSDILSVNSINGTQITGLGNIINLASGAILTISSDGSYSYNPNHAFDGLELGEQGFDSFTYVAQDNHGGLSNAATVTITIDGVTQAFAPPETSSLLVSSSSTTQQNTVLNSQDILVETNQIDYSKLSSSTQSGTGTESTTTTSEVNLTTTNTQPPPTIDQSTQVSSTQTQETSAPTPVSTEHLEQAVQQVVHQAS